MTGSQPDTELSSPQRDGQVIDDEQIEELPAPAEEDEVPLTREERLAMAAAMKKNCEDTQALLQRLVQAERDLKDVCLEFIVRDVEEENKRIELTRRCMAEQQETMRDTRFIKWAMNNGKDKEAFRNAPGNLDDGEGQDAAGQPHAFHELPPEGWHMGLQPAADVAPTQPTHLFCPSAALSQWMCGWRSAVSADIQAALDEIDAAVAAATEPCVLAVNGTLIYDGADVAHKPTPAAMRKFVSTLPRSLSIEQRYAAWRDWVTTAAASVPPSVALRTSSIVAGVMRDDGSDVLAVVPLHAVLGAALVRAVVVSGRVCCAESPQPNMDISGALGVSTADVVAAFQRLLAANQDRVPSRGSFVVSVAMKPSGELVILDCAKLTPDTRMDRFTWPDVCGIARVAQESASTPCTVRAPTVRVAEVEPFDAATAAWAAVITTGTAPRSALVDGRNVLIGVAALGLAAAAGMRFLKRSSTS